MNNPLRKISGTILPLILFLFTILLSGCVGNEKLTIGIVPSESPEKLKEEFSLIQEYLAKRLDRQVEVYIPDDYRELIQAIEEEKVDIALFGPFSYIVAETRQDLVPLLVRSKKSYGISYNSLILCRSDSEIQNLENLEGRKMAFVNSASTSGYMIPQSLFISRDIDIDRFFGSYHFAGSHDRVIEEVLKGESEAGAVSATILMRLIAQERINARDLRILWKSDPIPGSPYVGRRDLPHRLLDDFTDAMSQIHLEDPEALEHFDETIESYLPVEEGLYNPIRNIVNIMGREFIEENYL